MSDDFIPINQSTPLQNSWCGRNNTLISFQQNRHKKNYQRRRGNFKNKRGNNSSRSFASDSNSSYGRDKTSSIDAYLHPSMFEDPWAHLR